MRKTFRRMSGTVLASVTLAAASLFAPAPAQAIDMRCPRAVNAYCNAHWQALGFYGWADCYEYWYNAACGWPNPGDPNWPYLPPVP